MCKHGGWASRTGAVVRRRLDALVALCGGVVFLLCALVARSGRVGPTERAVFRWFNELPDALTTPMVGVQYLGVLAVGVVVAVVAGLCRRYRLAIAALLVTGAKLVAERLVWKVVERSRPGVEIPGAIVRGDTPHVGASFVSGHVVLVTALACVVTPYLRGRWRLVPWAIVALVAFARLFLGAHAPLDVLGGAALGAVLGSVVNLALGVPVSPEEDAFVRSRNAVAEG
jgi:membrane-associated phospholipid phosphatase